MLREQGQWAGAEQLYRDVMARSQITLGPEHPDTLRVLSDLANCLTPVSRKGDWSANGRSVGDVEGLLSQLEGQFREASEAMQQKMGPQHPRRLECLGKFATFLAERGCLEAEQLLKEVLAGWVGRVGEDHARTRRCQSRLDDIQSEKKHLVAGAFSQLDMEDEVAGASQQSTRDNGDEDGAAQAAPKLSEEALHTLPVPRGSSSVLSGSGQTEAGGLPQKARPPQAIRRHRHRQYLGRCRFDRGIENFISTHRSQFSHFPQRFRQHLMCPTRSSLAAVGGFCLVVGGPNVPAALKSSKSASASAGNVLPR